MAYADRDTTGSRTTAIIVVAIIVGALLYGLITGLAVDLTKKVANKLNVFDVTPPPPPPPPEPPPPPPPDAHLPPPPVVSPPPIVQTNVVTPTIQTVPTPPPVYIPTPTAPPPTPPAPPPAPRVSQAAGLKGNVASFFGPDSYPPAAQRAGAQGRVTARLSVGADGRVSDCSVSASSGNDDLDTATCRIAKSRVRFTPARDDNGNAMASTYPLAVRWVLPQE